MDRKYYTVLLTNNNQMALPQLEDKLAPHLNHLYKYVLAPLDGAVERIKRERVEIKEELAALEEFTSRVDSITPTRGIKETRQSLDANSKRALSS